MDVFTEFFTLYEDSVNKAADELRNKMGITFQQNDLTYFAICALQLGLSAMYIQHAHPISYHAARVQRSQWNPITRRSIAQLNIADPRFSPRQTLMPTAILIPEDA